MRVGVVTFPGSLDDGDAARAVRYAGGEPVALWHGDDDLGRPQASGTYFCRLRADETVRTMRMTLIR